MKYYVQEIATNYLKNLVAEPESITIHKEFLNGLCYEEFFDGYIALLRLFKSLYTDAAKDPAAFGMQLIEATAINPKNTDYTKSHDSFRRLPVFFLVLGAVGKIESDMSITICGSDLNSAIKKARINKIQEIINKLSDYGLEIEGFTKTIKNEDVLIINYPDCRVMLTVLKAMADAQMVLEKGDFRRSNIYFYMMNHDLVANYPIKEPKLTSNDMYRALTENNRKTAKIFNDCIGDKAKAKYRTLDFMRNRWHGAYTGVKSKKMLCTIKNEQDDLSVKLNLEHINDFIDVVMSLPVNLQESIRNNAWNCNQSQCNPKCAGGFKFRMNDVNYDKCRGGAFTFINITPEEAGYLTTLLELEMKREE